MTTTTNLSNRTGKRIVVFGVTGQLGQRVVELLDLSDWPIAELVGVASSESQGMDFDFRGESLDVVSEWPVLKGRDLVLICTPSAIALEIVREALRAEVPCIDCTGSLSEQGEVPMPMLAPMAIGSSEGDEASLATAPLLSIPCGTTLAWAPVLEALAVTRVVGTVVCSSAALGHRGLVALSEESIALFNQSEIEKVGPAGQGVAFDVIPGGGIDAERVRRECLRLLGEGLRIDVESIQVPTFIGEGAWLSIELAEPLTAAELEAHLTAKDGLGVVRGGVGSRGLAVVEEEINEPKGPTLRDASDAEGILVGQIRPDASLAEGLGWRLWLVFDPIRLSAEVGLRVAARRLGLA
jgi:aspartate-semialdehyde dehydrogenase